jgi:hypothetical protein
MGEYEAKKKLNFHLKNKIESQVILGLLRVFAHFDDLIWMPQ